MNIRISALLALLVASAAFIGTLPLGALVPQLSGIPMSIGWLVLLVTALASKRTSRHLGNIAAGVLGVGLLLSGESLGALAIGALALTSDRVRAERLAPAPFVLLGVLLGGASHAVEYYQSFVGLTLSEFQVGPVIWGSLSVAMAILGTLAMITGRLQKKTTGCGSVAARLSIPMPTPGILPYVIAVPVLDWSATMLSSPPPSPFDAISAVSITDASGWGLARLAVLYVFAFGLTRAFNPIDEIKRGWTLALGEDKRELAEGLAHRSLSHAARVSRWYLLALLFLHEFGGELIYALGVAGLVVGTAVVYDIRSELEYRREVGFYATIHEPGAIWEVAHVRAALEGAGIPVFVRGLGLHSVLRRLAFWGDLEVMVPGENLDQAEAIVRSLGLAPPYDHREDVDEEDDREDDHSA